MRGRTGIRRGAARALLPVLVAALLLGPAGGAGGVPLGQVWVQGPSLPTAFVPRWDFATAELPARGQVVLFGGAPAQPGGGWFNDTWVYSNLTSTWSRGPAAPAGLTPRGGMAAAFDPVGGNVVVFGGSGPQWPPLDETWLFDGTAWTKGPAAPAGLEGRVGAEMAYDPDIAKVVLFGGSGEGIYRDTWLYDGATDSWSPGPAAPAAMSARGFFGMTYDPVIHRVVVAGGNGGTDVWLFDGSQWTAGPALPSDTIGPRERVSMAFDPQLGGDVLFGGLGPGAGNTNLFVLKGGAWSLVTMHPSPRPKARVDAALVWNSSQQAFMVFAGVDDTGNGTAALADTWLLAAPGMTISPVTGPVGTQVVIASGPWVVGSQVNVYFQKSQLQTLTVPASGMVGTTVVVPATSTGTKTFKLLDTVHSLQETQSFTVIHPSASDLGPELSAAGPAAGTSAASATAGPAATVPTPPVRHVATPAVASGQVTAQGGDFYLGGNPILLHGLNGYPFWIRPGNIDMGDTDFAQIAAWNMNFVRLWMQWRNFEPTAPVKNPNGSWTHTYDSKMMDRLKAVIASAAAHGVYVELENYCGPPCYHNGWPDWLYKPGYNSHAKTYTSSNTANTDFWTDALQQQFVKDWLTWLASQLQGVPGIVGYEVLNEPSIGTYPSTHTTTQMILDTELKLAQAVRAADPPRVVFFMTRGAPGSGIPQADLSAWRALGNVATDVHGYFGGRWGPGLLMDRSNPNWGETLEPLFNFTLTPGMPPYLGTTYGMYRYCQNLRSFLGTIPLTFGEFGGQVDVDTNILNLFATASNGFDLCGASWTAMSFTGSNDIWKDDGSPQPWAPILAGAAAYQG